jgi:hypothetical protein
MLQIQYAKNLSDAIMTASDYQSNVLSGTNVERIPLLLDDPKTDAVNTAYEALPERLIVVDTSNMTVVYKSGEGPFQHDPNDLDKFLDGLVRFM